VNLDKIYWPATGMTKGQMLDYYRLVAPVLVPHLAGRPLTMARFPDGVEGAGWYQSNCPGAPPWLRTAARGRLRYAVVDDEAALLWVARLGTIELHPFLADDARPETPLAIVLDLDPGPPAGLLACARLALWLKDALAAREMTAFVKTSGKKGLHVYAAPRPGWTWRDAKAFAHGLAGELAAAHFDLVVGTMSRAARAGRIYLDWGQNDPSKSTIAPYSLRATRQPRVSMPLAWDEVAEALEARRPERLVFSPEDALARVDRVGDLWCTLAAWRIAPGSSDGR
jgi:bifunctional non-homologous end joining protein LigD